MKAAGCVLVLGALAALGIGPARSGMAAPPALSVPRCGSPAWGTDDHKPPKSSALAPRGHPGSHVYGAPIQQPIFRSRPKPKSPQSAVPQGSQPQR